MAWLMLLVVLALLLWFNKEGLPDGLKTKLLDALKQRGVILEFQSLHLSPLRGLVAEEVQLGGSNAMTAVHFRARQVQLRLDYPALLHGRWLLDGLRVRDGTLTLQASATEFLAITNLQSSWRFESQDTWVVDQFEAEFEGLRVNLSGRLIHAPEVANWAINSGTRLNLPHPSASPNRSNLGPLIGQLIRARQDMTWMGHPTLALFLDGDARNIHSISLRWEARLEELENPWFMARSIQAAGLLQAPANASLSSNADLGFWTNLEPFSLECSLHVNGFQMDGLDLDSLDVGGDWMAPAVYIKKCRAQMAGGTVDGTAFLDIRNRTISFTNDSSFDPHLLSRWLPAGLRVELGNWLWTRPPELHASGHSLLPPWTNAPASWPQWVAANASLTGQVSFTNAVANGLLVDWFQGHFEYMHDHWNWNAFHFKQGLTQLEFAGEADGATHQLAGALHGTVDLASVRPFFDQTDDSQFLHSFHLNQPAGIELEVAGQDTNWTGLQVRGTANLTNAIVDGAPGQYLRLDRVHSSFEWSNRCLTLPDFMVRQGHTRISGGVSGNLLDGQMNLRVEGHFDPETLQPLLPTDQARMGLALIHLENPLAFRVSVCGNWRNLESLTATGNLACTNFAIRGQAADEVTGNFMYTNRVLRFFNPQLSRMNHSQNIRADALTLDFTQGTIFFTNGFSAADPMYVVRCIGPKTTELVEPYHFPSLPTAMVNGSAPMRDVQGQDPMNDADLTFVILKPTPFQWQNLKSKGVMGTIHWKGQQLILTNLVGEVYGGKGWGNAHFYFDPDRPDARFTSMLTVTNVSLHELIADVSSPTNTLQGLLSGVWKVTDGDTGDWHTWNGGGHAGLHNGLLWNIPLFGLASGALNRVSPGLGNSRATDATMDYVMQHGVIHSDLLELHTPTMRLEYSGTVDLDEHVNARVTVLLLRNTPVVGPLVSTALWPFSKIFECQVSGTLEKPKVTPLWLPSPVSEMLLMPLHPIRTLQDLVNPP